MTTSPAKMNRSTSPRKKKPSRQVKEKQVTKTSKYAFTKRKSCLTNLTTFYDEMIVLVDEEKDDLVFLQPDLSKALGTIP